MSLQFIARAANKKALPYAGKGFFTSHLYTGDTGRHGRENNWSGNTKIQAMNRVCDSPMHIELPRHRSFQKRRKIRHTVKAFSPLTTENARWKNVTSSPPKKFNYFIMISHCVRVSQEFLFDPIGPWNSG